MSFLKSNFDQKPSLAKPILIVLVVLLVVGGAYVLGHKNTNNETAEKNSEAKQEVVEINSSGLDKDERVKKVADVEEVIAKWVEANPKAIIASVANMQKKAMEEQVKEAQKNIGTKKDEIFGDKNAPQYSPSGYNMTIVEFFDYSCGYCKKAQATVEELLKSDSKLRIIYKELPILGQASEEMSTVALAVNIIDAKSYKKFHDAMMKSNERGKAAAIKAAKNIGISESKLNEVLKNDKDKIAAMIQENRMLASSIGINGTPGFIIGEEFVPGAFELQAFKDKISAARSKN